VPSSVSLAVVLGDPKVEPKRLLSGRRFGHCFVELLLEFFAE